jgi:PhzF family phenazine biosynthesis protein
MRYFVVDAFASEIFKGNPAGVCLLEQPLDDETLQNIAAENNLATTAFIQSAGNGYNLRWFTPEVEIDLCGHATLASAFVLRNFGGDSSDFLDFFTKSGKLSVYYNDDLYKMDFPSRPVKQIPVLPEYITAIGSQISAAYIASDLLLLVESEEAVKTILPNFEAMRRLSDGFGVIVTAQGGDVDFVSRFFAPKAGIPEDPVTGRSHTSLISFWADRLNKDVLTAKQLSKRGGMLWCKNSGDRVKIAGQAVLYLSGTIRV